MSEQKVPRHVGYIIDGNRRWAKQHGLPVYEGHLAGYNSIQEVAIESFKLGIEFVTVYVFSTENWKRSQGEVRKLMGLVLKLMTDDLHILIENGIRLRIIGSRDGLSEKLLSAIDSSESETAKLTKGNLTLCVNYGGQLELVDAIKKVVQSEVPVDEISVELIAQNLYAPDVPPIDLVVRTGGEKRISNFMLWRIEYSEFLFLDKMWPDMKRADVRAILKEYAKRNRRIGK